MPSEKVLELRKIKIVPTVLTQKEGKNRHYRRRLLAKAEKKQTTPFKCDRCGNKYRDVVERDNGQMLCDDCYILEPRTE